MRHHHREIGNDVIAQVAGAAVPFDRFVPRTQRVGPFEDELLPLDELEARYSDRLAVLHVLSRQNGHPPALRGRIEADKLMRWFTEELDPAQVDEWFMCGPAELVTTARDLLIEHGVDTAASTSSCSSATRRRVRPPGTTPPRA
jgi:ferredoxin-NADP reductase